MDRELKRVVKYAKGLGLSVAFKPYKPRSGTGGYYDGVSKEIVVYQGSRDTKTDMILVLLHELGHHLDFIYKGKRDPKKLSEALDKEHARKETDPPLARHLRQFIFDCEYNGTQYMPVLAKELDLKIPLWKVEAEAKLDQWVYRRYLVHGKDPLRKATKAKRKQLRMQWKAKYEQTKT